MYCPEFLLLNAAASVVQFVRKPTVDNKHVMKMTIADFLDFVERPNNNHYQIVGVDELMMILEEVPSTIERRTREIIFDLADYTFNTKPYVKMEIQLELDALDVLTKCGYTISISVADDIFETIEDLIKDYYAGDDELEGN